MEQLEERQLLNGDFTWKGLTLTSSFFGFVGYQIGAGHIGSPLAHAFCDEPNSSCSQSFRFYAGTPAGLAMGGFVFTLGALLKCTENNHTH